MRFRTSRALLLFGAVVAVLLLFLPLAACDDARSEPRPGRAGSSVAPAPDIPSAPGLPGWSHSLGFAADGSGFALLAECAEARCAQHVAVLDKGARRWGLATSPLPDVTGDLGITAGLTVLGPGRAVIIDQSEHWQEPAPTWFTGDGGLTWARGSTKPKGSTATVPEGALLTDECLELEADGSFCGRNRLLVVMPDTGEHRVLKRQPPLKGILAPAGDMSPDALFVSGLDDSDRPALAKSEDRGRTWTVTRIAHPGTGSRGFHVVPGPGWGRLFAVQPGQLPEREQVKNGLRAIHTSTDGGSTWTRVWTYREGVEPLSILGDLVVAADGSVTVYGESGIWRSTDGARTFRSDGGARAPAGSVTRTPLGWLWSDSHGNGQYRISADGVRWHGFALGEAAQ